MVRAVWVLAHLGSSLYSGISSGGIQPIAGVSKPAVPTGKRAFELRHEYSYMSAVNAKGLGELRAAPIRFVWLRLGQALALYVCCVFPEAAFAIVHFRCV